MDKLEIQGTNDTPFIFCDAEKKEILLTGRSLPENPFKVYEKVFSWAEKYDQDSILLNFKLEYFNTASSKQIFNLIKLFVENKQVKEIKVKWYYEEGDYDSKETGEHFANLFRIPFEFIEYTETQY
ncbi:MAG: DUF1987 domain-containing protein [Bacteroidales bacterium]|nr:DUF1987 domain-containing protein [Bacteroidales bacterium]